MTVNSKILLDRLLVAVHQAAGLYFPHDVVGVRADRTVDAVRVLVVEVHVNRRDVAGDDVFTFRCRSRHVTSVT
jgi:hypothetical protein